MNKLTSSLRRWLLPSLLVVCAFALAVAARAAEVIPQVPTRYFNDYALTVKPETADRLNRELEDLEKQSSNQILVVVYPQMQTDSSVEDYCHRITAAWKVGQQGKNNGAVLFVFVQNHKMWIEVRPGLEGVLPDATCKDITADVIAPKFKAGDYDAGLTAGVEALIAASKGEYKGTGRTAYQDSHGQTAGGGGWTFALFFVLIVIYLLWSAFRREFRTPGTGGRGAMYSGGGPIFFPGGFGGGGSGFGGGGGGGSSSSSSSDDGGGFFSSGGGSDSGGGGGAGSDW